jgi:glutathione S-transferase
VKVYRIPFSTNVERVALAAGHKGLELEWIDVDPADRSEVERVSGQGLVPVLVDGDSVVFDSPEILRYLERLHPEPPLFPSEEPLRSRVEIFLAWFNHVWKRAPNEIFAEELGPHPNGERIARLGGTMTATLPLFEGLLSGADYLFGSFTVADVAAFPFLKFALLWPEGDDHRFHEILRDHLTLAGRYPRLEAWIRRVDAHPRA